MTYNRHGDCPSDFVSGRRGLADRRKQPTSPWDALRRGGRRMTVRRDEEREGAYFVDRFDAVTFALILALLALTLIDGLLTIELLDVNSEEFNPLMDHLLSLSHGAFLMGKYVLTAAGLPFLIVYKNYPMFGTRFRVGYLLHVFVGLYLALITYQLVLLRAGPLPRAEIGAASAIATAPTPPRMRAAPLSRAGELP